MVLLLEGAIQNRIISSIANASSKVYRPVAWSTERSQYILHTSEKLSSGAGHIEINNEFRIKTAQSYVRGGISHIVENLHLGLNVQCEYEWSMRFHFLPSPSVPNPACKAVLEFRRHHIHAAYFFFFFFCILQIGSIPMMPKNAPCIDSSLGFGTQP